MQRNQHRNSAELQTQFAQRNWPANRKLAARNEQRNFSKSANKLLVAFWFASRNCILVSNWPVFHLNRLFAGLVNKFAYTSAAASYFFNAANSKLELCSHSQSLEKKERKKLLATPNQLLYESRPKVPLLSLCNKMQQRRINKQQNDAI